MQIETCEKCNQTMRLVKVIDERSALMACEHCHKRKMYFYDKKEFPDNINSFNWGIFTLWPFWGFSNGMPYLFLIYLGLSLISFLLFPAIILFILSIYYGMKGSFLSWKKKNWDSIGRFEDVQNKWNEIGIFVFIIYLVALFFIVIF